MIKLTISAGYAWTVWDDKGGLQPTVPSLLLPKDVCAPLEAWTFRSIPGSKWPVSSEREGFDAEGRTLAGDLQRALGDRIHIIFHHWVAFDPARWRTRWREEDLCSGQSKGYWLDEDLPEAIALKVIRIFPDYAGAYLWDAEGTGIGNDNPAFPDDLDQRFIAWSESWEVCHDSVTWKIDKERLARENFDGRGLELASELKQAVGEACRVIYYCRLRRATLEMMPDGRTVEWPRDTDFRQWAIENSAQIRS